MTSVLLATCAGGIPFRSDDVRAIRDGRKTRFTVPIKPQPGFVVEVSGVSATTMPGVLKGLCPEIRQPYQPGKRYFVRETWAYGEDENTGSDCYFYRERDDWTGPWQPAATMPKDAARYVIEIADVQAMRLQDFTEEMAIAEGLRKLSKDGGFIWKFGIPDSDGLPGTDDTGWPWREWSQDYRAAMAKAWDALNKKAPWASNPWVFTHALHLVKT